MPERPRQRVRRGAAALAVEAAGEPVAPGPAQPGARRAQGPAERDLQPVRVPVGLVIHGLGQEIAEPHRAQRVHQRGREIRVRRPALQFGHGPRTGLSGLRGLGQPHRHVAHLGRHRLRAFARGLLGRQPAQVQHMHGVHASGDQDRPAGQIRHRRRDDRTGVADRTAEALTARRVPYLRGGVQPDRHHDRPAVQLSRRQGVRAGLPERLIEPRTCGRVPQPHRAVGAGEDDDGPAVPLGDRAGRDDASRRIRERPAEPPVTGQVPHPYGGVAARGDGDHAAFQRRRQHRGHAGGVAGERLAELLVSGQVPDPDRAVGTSGDGDGAAVEPGRGHGGDPAGVAGERAPDLGAELGAGREVPHPDRAVGASGDRDGPVAEPGRRHGAEQGGLLRGGPDGRRWEGRGSAGRGVPAEVEERDDHEDQRGARPDGDQHPPGALVGRRRIHE